MIDHQHTMPIGVIPNQLQALADELGQAKREIAELRGLLAEVLKEFGWHDGLCYCKRCEIKNGIKAVLER